jgi:3-phosphoshikimate 1-carboxyvinyltransferase
MARGKTELLNLPDGEDVTLMREALHQLGVQCERKSETSESITGETGPWVPQSSPSISRAQTRPALPLFLGNSGTSMRILTATLCGGHGSFTLDGIPRMRERPIGDLIAALLPLCGETVLGYGDKSGFPPLTIEARGLQGGKTQIAGGVSSQFTTGLLLSLPLCREPVTVTVKGRLVSAPYVAMTLAIMRDFGVVVDNQNFESFHWVPGQHYQSPGNYVVEPDASSASYFLAAGAIAGGKVRVNGIGKSSLQGEAGFAQALERMGARVSWHDKAIEVSPPAQGRLQGIDLDADTMSDTGMTLAVTALFAETPTLIRGIGTWRVKETDRIEAMATELRKVGASIESGPDWIKITPPKTWQSATFDTYNDHRMAMCMSLTCLGNITATIREPGCVVKTYPGYFEALQSILHVGKNDMSPHPKWSQS